VVDVLRAFALGELVEDPRFTTAEVRGSNMPQLRSILQERAATQPSDYWLKRLVEADIPCTLVQDYDMLAQDPRRWRTAISTTTSTKVRDPAGGRTRGLLQQDWLGPAGPGTWRAWTAYQAILANAGFTSEEIAHLRANKVVS